MSGTVKMGTNAGDACVDSRFRVFGLQALRVVDMSVVPFVPKYVPSYDQSDTGAANVLQLPHAVHGIYLRRAGQ
jgi:hypothetical protein